MAAIVLGSAAGGEPVAIGCFTADRAFRAAVIGDPSLPKLLALRALSAGAKVAVVTSRPEEWLRLRGSARQSAERMAIVAPDSLPPADAGPAKPWMSIREGAVEPDPLAGPWQAVVAVPDSGAVTVAALRGLDAVLLYRSIPAWRAAAVAALNLSGPAALSLHGIPRDVVAIASAGAVRFVRLTPDSSERRLLDQSAHAHPPVLLSSARRFFDTKVIRAEGEVA